MFPYHSAAPLPSAMNGTEKDHANGMLEMTCTISQELIVKFSDIFVSWLLNTAIYKY